MWNISAHTTVAAHLVDIIPSSMEANVMHGVKAQALFCSLSFIFFVNQPKSFAASSSWG